MTRPSGGRPRRPGNPQKRRRVIADAAWETLVEDFETAKQRAKALDERHAGNGSPPRSNPSTDVWRLVDRLNSGAEPA